MTMPAGWVDPKKIKVKEEVGKLLDAKEKEEVGKLLDYYHQFVKPALDDPNKTEAEKSAILREYYQARANLESPSRTRGVEQEIADLRKRLEISESLFKMHRRAYEEAEARNKEYIQRENERKQNENIRKQNEKAEEAQRYVEFAAREKVKAEERKRQQEQEEERIKQEEERIKHGPKYITPSADASPPQRGIVLTPRTTTPQQVQQQRQRQLQQQKIRRSDGSWFYYSSSTYVMPVEDTGSSSDNTIEVDTVDGDYEF
jgi:hypothetical protein